MIGEHREPLPLEWQRLPLEVRMDPRITVPPGEELELHLVRPPLVPYPRCRRIRLDDGRKRACRVRATDADVAYMGCRGCGHRFAVPIRSQG